eukprot:scaffold5237_cov179-Amphora_coffeaeformis.AAC.8
MSKSALNGLDPLKDLLGDVLARLEALEAKVGIKGSSMTKQPSKSQVTSAQLNGKSRARIFGVLRCGPAPKFVNGHDIKVERGPVFRS